MSTEGRELGWDDSITQENSFIELPEGDYDFTINHYERGRFAGSAKIPPCNKATVFFDVKDADANEVSIRQDFLLHTKMEWKLSELFRSVGLKGRGRSTHELECSSGVKRKMPCHFGSRQK